MKYNGTEQALCVTSVELHQVFLTSSKKGIEIFQYLLRLHDTDARTNQLVQGLCRGYKRIVNFGGSQNTYYLFLIHL